MHFKGGPMNRSLVVVAALCGFALGARPLAAMSFPGTSDVLALSGKLNCPVVPASGGKACLQIALSARDQSPSSRRPLNLCVVLDRSGSMGEEGKMASAKAALCALIEGLRMRISSRSSSMTTSWMSSRARPLCATAAPSATWSRGYSPAGGRTWEEDCRRVSARPNGTPPGPT